MPAVSKKMKKQLTSKSNEDSSDDTPDDSEEETTVPKRRSSTRLQNCSKKPRFAEATSSSEEDPFATDGSDSSLDSASFSKGRSRVRKKWPSKPSNKVIKEEVPKDKPNSTKNNHSSFVVLKVDMQKGVYPDLWKIDGKSLLQKYVPFEEGEETLYKNTSVYSGWTLNSRDQYMVADVDFVRQTGRETVVRLKIDIPPVDSD